MKKLLLTLAVLCAVSFSYAGDDKAADKAACPAKEEKCCCKDGKGECCKDKAAHPKDCSCDACKAAAAKDAKK